MYYMFYVEYLFFLYYKYNMLVVWIWDVDFKVFVFLILFGEEKIIDL